MLLLNINALHAKDRLAPSYRWGQGYHIPAANLTLGGYFKASYNYLEKQGNELELKDLSLFISWRPFSRLHLFSELELEYLFSLDGVRPFGEAFRVERLYADILLTEEWTVRLGQYLTPVSRWNVLHAAPLVWTSSRPMISEDFMLPNHAAGLEILYNTSLFEHDFDVSLFTDNSQNLLINDHESEFDYAFGVSLSYQIHSTFHIGSSYAYSKIDQEDKLDTQHILGFDFLWQIDRYELQFESLLKLRDNSDKQFGLYLQGVAPLIGNLFAVARYEYLTMNQERDTQIGVIGLTWRPAPPLAVKIEYRFGQENEVLAPSGFLSSIAMFF